MNSCTSEPPRVLVVDDHPTSRASAVSLLTLEGYEVLEAENGQTALEQIRNNTVDLILLDVMMPDIDGYEVCRHLKQDEQTRLLPIVFITALTDRRARLKGIEVGADDFLSKPFDPLELSARVKSLVRQRRLNEDLDHASQMLFSLARTIERRDPNTGDHCERLVNLGQAFGKFLRLSRQDIHIVKWAGYLHDIGKIGIPDAVLLKTGPLTPAEQVIMRQHVLIGEQICQPLRTMRGVIPVIRHHHERWDGSGYPDRLVGDQIPFLVQVFQLVDIYDALTHERPYKPALSSQESLSIMLAEVEKGWRNPDLMQQFMHFILSQQVAA